MQTQIQHGDNVPCKYKFIKAYGKLKDINREEKWLRTPNSYFQKFLTLGQGFELMSFQNVFRNFKPQTILEKNSPVFEILTLQGL